MLIDTHCHLDQFEDPEEALDRAAERGVGRVVAVSEDPESARVALGLKKRFPGRVLAGIGLHPVWVVQKGHEDIEQALSFLAENMAAADILGEVGLDFKWAETEEQKTLQDEVLEKQFEIAARHERPVNLHSRRCLRQVMERAVAFHRETGLNATGLPNPKNWCVSATRRGSTCRWGRRRSIIFRHRRWRSPSPTNCCCWRRTRRCRLSVAPVIRSGYARWRMCWRD